MPTRPGLISTDLGLLNHTQAFFRAKLRRFLTSPSLPFLATINRLARERFAQLEGALETTVNIRPIGSLGLGGRRSTPLPFDLEEQIKMTNPNLRVDPYLIHRELRGERAEFYSRPRILPRTGLGPLGKSLSHR